MSEIQRLLDIMARLRDPERGCPWDREQDFASIAPYTLEEAYEVAEAIQEGDMQGLCSELGDLLFQVVFHARMAEEAGSFDFADVVNAVCEKMVRRHPHVFGDETVDSAEAQSHAWERHKLSERRSEIGDSLSHMDRVSVALPAMTRSVKLQRRAARAGFDWPAVAGVLQKLDEEVAELRAEIGAANSVRIAEELGDLMFTCANLARHLEVDPESALRRANSRFEHRFRHMEARARERGQALEQLDAAQLDVLWEQAKRALASGKPP